MVNLSTLINDATPIATSAPVPVKSLNDQLLFDLRRKAPKATAAYAVARLALPYVKRWKASYDAKHRYQITVRADNSIYDDLHEWLLGLLADNERHALEARSIEKKTGGFKTSSRGYILPGSTSESRRLHEMVYRYDGSVTQIVTIAEHPVVVAIVNEDEGSSSKNAWSEETERTTLYDFMRRSSKPKMTLTARSLEGRNAVQEHLYRLLQLKCHETDSPRLYMPIYNEWNKVSSLQARTLDSVVLKEGQMDRIVDDIERWRKTEQTCYRRYIPWRRGYLFEGPPGTGKTSIARALAGHFNMDMYYMPLSTASGDQNLLNYFNGISSNSVVVLEDIDVFQATHERSDNDNGVDGRRLTLSGLLNAMDGIASPQGVITILTSNKPSVLDPALLRPGRIDKIEHFGYADEYQIKQLIARYFDTGRVVDLKLFNREIAPAEVLEACKRSDSPDAAVQILREGLAPYTNPDEEAMNVATSPMPSTKASNVSECI